MKSTTKTFSIAIASLLLGAAATYFIVNPSHPELAATAAASTLDSAETSQSKGGLAAHDKDGDGIVYQDAMHPWIVLDEPGPSPDCGMDLTPVNVDGQSEAGTVEIDPVTIQNIGVRTAPVTVESLGREIRTTGRFVMDESGERGVTLKVSGYIEKLYANYEGFRIRKGQPLLELYSPDLVSTQEEYLLALQNMKRLRGTSSADDARRLLDAARRRLAYWDLSKEQIRTIEESGTPQRTITFYAPSSGEVMHTQVAEGDYVKAGQKLMDITDISKIWLMVDVYERDLPWVKRGTPALVELPYDPGKVYEGKVDFMYHMLDMQLRAAKARIVLPGGHHAPMKPGMYATVRLVGSPTEPGPVVPLEAVIRTGEESVIVLALGDGRFRPTTVRTGVESDGKVQVLGGLDGGETVVTSAQFLIDSEARLQSAISAMTGSSSDEPAGQMDEPSGPMVDEPSGPMNEPETANHIEASPAPMPRGSSEAIRIAVGPSGFEPNEIALNAGTPSHLIFTRTTEQTCAKQVMIPELGVKKTDLPLNQPVAIEVTVEGGGRFTFACGMDMLKGTLVVTR